MTNWFRLNETVNSLISWIGDKQEQLISSVNIKTINGVDILGSGNIDITKSDVGLPLAQNTAFNKNFGTTAGTVVEGGTLGSNAYNSTAYLPLSGGTLTGIVTAPTAPAGTNTTQIATTAFVQGTIPIVSQTITNGVTDKSPSEDAVFDALALKQNILIENDSSIASVSNLGKFRYRSDSNNSYVDMVMQIGVGTFAWVNIVSNNW